MPIARAFFIVPRSPRRHAMAPLAARIARPYAHLTPRRLAASVTTPSSAVWVFIEHIIFKEKYYFTLFIVLFPIGNVKSVPRKVISKCTLNLACNE